MTRPKGGYHHANSTQLNSTQLNSTQLNSKPKLALAGLALILLSFTTFTAQASLTAGTAGGQSVVYSSISNVTWTGDGNLLGTLEANNPNLVNTIISTIGAITDSPNASDTPTYSGIHTLSTADFGANGFVNWFGAQAYTKYLNTINYAGSNQWALPSAGANPLTTYNQQNGSQFNQLFYNELGGVAGGLIPNTANFTNLQGNSYYWSVTELAAMPVYAWFFNTALGYQNAGYKQYYQFNAWAVSPGTITGFTASAVPAAVPVPAAVWLFGSGLVGLLGFTRRNSV